MSVPREYSGCCREKKLLAEFCGDNFAVDRRRFAGNKAELTDSGIISGSVLCIKGVPSEADVIEYQRARTVGDAGLRVGMEL